MVPLFLRFGAAGAVLLVAASSPGAVAQQTVPHFELDMIFPRNETYTPSDIFPIAFALQNLTAVRSLGAVNISWDIMPFAQGWIPGGLVYDQGQFAVLPPEVTDANNDTFIFVANSNVTAWIHKKNRGDRFAVNWHVNWPEYQLRCGNVGTDVFGHILFGVEGAWEREDGGSTGWDDAGQGVAPDVMALPECPVLGAVVEIRPNATNSSCPVVIDENTGREADPCRVVVDEAVASSIASQAASLATPPPATTTTRSASATPTNAAPSAPNPALHSVLAAACVLSCLTFAS
jgi:hypothetical protein